MTESSSPYASSSAGSSPSKHITVVDVYELAASINQDFEKIAELNGRDSIQRLVGKVISALETLEALAKHNDEGNAEIADLQRTVARLEQEKHLRLKDKKIFEKDVAELEENYKREIDDLYGMVKDLQTENKQIKAQLDSAKDSQEAPVEKVREDEFQMLVDLRKRSTQQKDQIRDLQRDVENYCGEVENLQNSVEKLIRQNKELLRKNSSLQKQGRLLVQERSELLRRIQESEEDNIQLRKILAETSRACKDLETQQETSDNTPKFTLAELREVLQEKNTLKAKVMELEEQLEFYRSASSNSSENGDKLKDRFENLSRPSSSASTNPDAHKPKPPEEPRSEECVVYGPLPREPDEKLYPPSKFQYERKDSGVRRLFRFFKDLNTGGLSPRRGSSVTPTSK